jgi:hypothetical protein
MSWAGGLWASEVGSGAGSGDLLHSWRAASLAAAPIAGPITAFGVLSPAEELVIPANSLGVGSHIKIIAEFVRTGSAAAIVPSAFFGTTNDITSNALSSVSWATTVTTGRLVIDLFITSATTFTASVHCDRFGIGAADVQYLFTTNFDITEDNNITFGTSTITSPDSLKLLSYDVQVFQ